MGFNNPTQLAIDEARKIWSGREIGLVVSIAPDLGLSLYSLREHLLTQKHGGHYIGIFSTALPVAQQ
jgi:hypothetical protein